MLCCTRVSESKKSEKSRKFWEQKSNFELRKENLTLSSNDSKFDLFILAFMICFIDLFQKRMILFSSKMMKKILIVKITSFRIDLMTTSRLTKRIDSRWASRISTKMISRIDRIFTSRRFKRSCSWINWKIASRSTKR